MGPSGCPEVQMLVPSIRIADGDTITNVGAYAGLRYGR